MQDASQLLAKNSWLWYLYFQNSWDFDAVPFAPNFPGKVNFWVMRLGGEECKSYAPSGNPVARLEDSCCPACPFLCKNYLLVTRFKSWLEARWSTVGIWFRLIWFGIVEASILSRKYRNEEFAYVLTLTIILCYILTFNFRYASVESNQSPDSPTTDIPWISYLINKFYLPHFFLRVVGISILSVPLTWTAKKWLF